MQERSFSNENDGTKSEPKKAVGRKPKTIWKDLVEKEVKFLGEGSEWKEKASYRKDSG